MDVAFGKTVSLIHRVFVGYDPMGSPLYDEEREDVGNSVVVPESGSEDARGSSNTATGRLTWYAPAGTPVAVTDVVDIDGQRYDVNGPPLDYGVHAVTGVQGRVTVSLVKHT